MPVRSLIALFITTAAVVVAVPASAGSVEGAQHPSASPLVIGHRGASGLRPEHTLASYELAARLGADYIEPDLVITQDGVLVARHEPEISSTTDVAAHPEFARRHTTKVVDGAEVAGWFTEDFTLAELRTLRAVERIPMLRQHNTLYNGRELIPTLQEIIDLAKRLSHELHREIGIYPETKHPTYFRAQNLPLEPALVTTLNRNGLNTPAAPVFVQSFEVGNLQALRDELRVPLVQLLGGTGAPYDFVLAGDPRTYADLARPEGLRFVASYASGIGPDKNRIVPRDANGFLLPPTTLVTDAHAAGLVVHPYTFRNENNFLPADFRSDADLSHYGNAFGEYATFFQLGIDGLFTDNPDTALEARDDLT